jgi:hypothetical protein
MNNNLEELNSDDSELEKLKTDQFILENLINKKQFELVNLEGLLKRIKGFKKRKTTSNSDKSNNPNFLKIEIESNEEPVLRKILSDNLKYVQSMYQQLSHLTIAEKNQNSEKRKRIDDIKSEIEKIKFPPKIPLTKNVSNISELQTNHQTNNINTHSSANQDPSNNLLMLMDNNSNLTLNNANTNINTVINNNHSNNNNNSQIQSENQIKLLKLEETIKQSEEHLSSNSTIINSLKEVVTSYKRTNEKLERGVNDMNNDLSNKFSKIYELEIELEKLKLKKKNRLIKG